MRCAGRTVKLQRRPAADLLRRALGFMKAREKAEVDGEPAPQPQQSTRRLRAITEWFLALVYRGTVRSRRMAGLCTTLNTSNAEAR